MLPDAAIWYSGANSHIAGDSNSSGNGHAVICRLSTGDIRYRDATAGAGISLFSGSATNWGQ